MTPEQRSEARKRCEAATEGPYFVAGPTPEHPEYDYMPVPNWPKDFDHLTYTKFKRQEDCDFYCHARTDLPAALDHIDALEARLARAEGALRKIACFDDVAANERLAKTGSYGSFDEPNSVRIARDALKEQEGSNVLP